MPLFPEQKKYLTLEIIFIMPHLSAISCLKVQVQNRREAGPLINQAGRKTEHCFAGRLPARPGLEQSVLKFGV